LITDYPNPDLIHNIEYNVRENVNLARKGNVVGYIWGHSVQPLLASLQDRSNTYPDLNEDLFDLIIHFDLIFNHSQHDALLKTCHLSLIPSLTTASLLTPSVLVFYTHRRPHLAYRDMEFFEKAQDQGRNCVEVVTPKFDPMFPEDLGEEEVRATVHGWLLT
ncbi:hypothetical protein EV368DRAFT_3193, partial [Lentinula lateritia]